MERNTLKVVGMPIMIRGTGDVGVCCSCDTTDGHGRRHHVEQHELFVCQNPLCGHWVCRIHRQPCGFCEGCCAEEHGLGSHKEATLITPLTVWDTGQTVGYGYDLTFGEAFTTIKKKSE